MAAAAVRNRRPPSWSAVTGRPPLVARFGSIAPRTGWMPGFSSRASNGTGRRRGGSAETVPVRPVSAARTVTPGSNGASCGCADVEACPPTAGGVDSWPVGPTTGATRWRGVASPTAPVRCVATFVGSAAGVVAARVRTTDTRPCDGTCVGVMSPAAAPGLTGPVDVAVAWISIPARGAGDAAGAAVAASEPAVATGSAPASPASDGAAPGEGTAAATEGAAVAAAGGAVAAEGDGVVGAGGAGGGSCAGITAGAAAGETAGSGSGSASPSGTGAGSFRGGSNPSGSTYPSSSAALRMPRWTLGTDCSGVPLVPIVPTAAPSPTVSPFATPISPRWTSVTA